MAVTVTLYNHTAARLASGGVAGKVFKLRLCTAATFNPAHTALNEVTFTEHAHVNGYSTGGVTLANVTVTTPAGSNDAKFDCDDATWLANGGPITASYGILYCDSDSGDPPLAFLDLGGEQSTVDGTQFVIVWSSNGVFTWTVS